MATTKTKPPAKAKSGNTLFDVKKAGLGGGSLVAASPGLGGMGQLVRGDVKPAYVLGGIGLGVVGQQLVSQIGVQQIAGGGPVLGDGIAAGAGIGLHFLVRSSLTLGVMGAMAAPFLAQGTSYAVNWLAGVIRKWQAPKVTTTTTPMGGNLTNAAKTAIPNMAQNIRTRAA